MRPPGNIRVDTRQGSNFHQRSVSPTGFPGNFSPSGLQFVPDQPMFPDMRRDDFVSKSSTSTRETAVAGVDSWSLSADSDEHYRLQQSKNRGHHETNERWNGGRRDARGPPSFHTYNEISEINKVRKRASPRGADWRQHERIDRQDRSLSPIRESKSRNRSRIRQRPRGETHEYGDDQVGRRYNRSDEYQQRVEAREHMEDYRRPQHQFATEDYFSPRRPYEENDHRLGSYESFERELPHFRRESPLRFTTLRSRIEENKRSAPETINQGYREDNYGRRNNQDHLQENGYRKPKRSIQSSPRSYNNTDSSRRHVTKRGYEDNDRWTRESEIEDRFRSDGFPDDDETERRRTNGRRTKYRPEDFNERDYNGADKFDRRENQKHESRWSSDEYTPEIDRRERSRRLPDDVVEKFSMPSLNHSDTLEEQIGGRRTTSRGRNDSRHRYDSRGRNDSRDRGESRSRFESRGRSDSRDRRSRSSSRDRQSRSDSRDRRSRSDSQDRSDSRGLHESRRRYESRGRNKSRGRNESRSRSRRRGGSVKRATSRDNRDRGKKDRKYRDDNSSAEESHRKRRDESSGRNRSVASPQNSSSKSTSTNVVIDISRSDLAGAGVDEPEVKFSPSTDIAKNLSKTLLSPVKKDVGSPIDGEYSRRIADANLMKEQSEARHQILKEVRQAMEMKDLSEDLETRRFWERQVKTLNASLKRLLDIDDKGVDEEDQQDLVDRRVVEKQSLNIANQIPKVQVPAPKIVDPMNLPSSPLPQTPVNNFTSVKVQAPEDLPAGHQFTIRVNGKPMKAQVPIGGVSQGDVFSIRIPLSSPPATPTITTPTSSSSIRSTVKVRAPATMPEGYRFTAKMGDRTIVATVPRGGVKKGEVFVVKVEQQKTF